jgi:SAM-dependent methyltransferase
LFAGDRWIADGNYGGTFDERFSRADTVIVLALPRLRCLAGALKRSALSHGKAMQAEGCPERFQLSFFRWIWNYDRDSRPRLDAALARHGHLDVVELTSRRAVRDFLESVEVSNVQRPGTSSGPGRRWNSNLHAFDQLLRAVPVGARCGLDVGCGEGETARRLRQRVPSVVGLDDDLASIELARSHGDDIDYLHGALETVELPAGAFDVVTAVAMLHHLDQRSGLARLAALVRPGGLLLVVGLARSRSIADFARDARDAVAIRRYTFTRDVWEKPAPKMWPPPLTYGETRAASLSVLPECQFRRVGHFRYGLTWVRPDDDAYRPT